MGKRGPAPKPTALKLLQGTLRPDRAAVNEPRPEPALPSCPSWLDREAKRCWRRLVPELAKLGLVTELDRSALAAYCQAYSDWWRMSKDIEENGETQLSKRTGFEQLRPQVTMRDRALDRMEKIGAKFGLSPSDRTRISVPEPKKKPQNPFAELGS